MPEPESILEDDRDIYRVQYDDGSHYEVGRNGITRIVSYRENGQMALVPWIAVYKGDDIYVRIPLSKVSIYYAPKHFR